MRANVVNRRNTYLDIHAQERARYRQINRADKRFKRTQEQEARTLIAMTCCRAVFCGGPQSARPGSFHSSA